MKYVIDFQPALPSSWRTGIRYHVLFSLARPHPHPHHRDPHRADVAPPAPGPASPARRYLHRTRRHLPADHHPQHRGHGRLPGPGPSQKPEVLRQDNTTGRSRGLPRRRPGPVHHLAQYTPATTTTARPCRSSVIPMPPTDTTARNADHKPMPVREGLVDPSRPRESPHRLARPQPRHNHAARSRSGVLSDDAQSTRTEPRQAPATRCVSGAGGRQAAWRGKPRRTAPWRDPVGQQCNGSVVEARTTPGLTRSAASRCRVPRAAATEAARAARG